MSVAEDYLKSGHRTPAVRLNQSKPSTTVTPDPNKPDELVARWTPWAERLLLPLFHYSENWDGYNAAAPHFETMVTAAALLANLRAYFLTPEPHVSPTRDGGVSLEWEADSKYLEIEVDSPTTLTYLYKDSAANRRQTDSFAEDAIPEEFFRVLQQMF